MEEFKGTKGPWKPFYTRIMGDTSGGIQEITIMPDRRQANQHVAITWDIKQVGRNGGLTFKEAEANSRLISASLILLKSLQRCALLMESSLIPGGTELVEYIEAKEAINKALNG